MDFVEMAAAVDAAMVVEMKVRLFMGGIVLLQTGKKTII
jgi:hypothetical protein